MNYKDTVTTIQENQMFGTTNIIGSERMTYEELLEKSGLDWEVEKQELYSNSFESTGIYGIFRDNPHYQNVPAGIDGADSIKWEKKLEKRTGVKNNTRLCLGAVGKDYQIIQNREAFKFTSDIVHGQITDTNLGKAQYQAAGTFKNGKGVFLTLKLDEGFNIGPDKISGYINCFTGHGGNSSLKIVYTPVRMSCTNMIATVMKRAHSQISIIHTKSATQRINLVDTRKVLGLVEYQRQYMAKSFDELLKKHITEWRFDDIVNEVFNADEKGAVSKRTQEQRDKVKDIWNNKPDLQEIKYTGWGAYNAFTDYYTHHQRYNGDGEKKFENRFYSTHLGPTLTKRDKAYNVIANV